MAAMVVSLREGTSHLCPPFVPPQPISPRNSQKSRRDASHGKHWKNRHFKRGATRFNGSARVCRSHDGLERLNEKRQRGQGVIQFEYRLSPFCLHGSHNFEATADRPSAAREVAVVDRKVNRQIANSRHRRLEVQAMSKAHGDMSCCRSPLSQYAATLRDVLPHFATGVWRTGVRGTRSAHRPNCGADSDPRDSDWRGRSASC
jgi:hypothetical protein